MKCWRRTSPALLLLSLASPALAQGQLSREQMAEDVKQFVALTRRAYSYVEEKKEQYGVDLDRIESRALARVARARSNAEFHDVLREAVAALHDGHCEIYAGHLQAPRPRVWPFAMEFVTEGVAVAGLHPRLGEDRGIARGDLVREVNGRPVGAWVEEAALLVSASTPGARKRMALRRMTATADAEGRVKVEHPGGKTAALTLPTLPPAPPAAAKFVEARLLRPQVGYLRLPSFAWTAADFQRARTDAERDKALEPARRAIDEAFARVAGTRALILDLRDNGGGADLLGAYLVSHLLPQDFVYYSIRTRSSPDLRKLPGFDYLPRDGGWGPKWVWKPRGTVFTFFKGEPYAGKVVALIDETCFSTTDCVLACLADLYPRIRFVGRPTHGGSGGPTTLAPLAHSKAPVQLCVMQVWSPKGRLIEGRGTKPDVEVEWTREDVRGGRDPDAEAALREAAR